MKHTILVALTVLLAGNSVVHAQRRRERGRNPVASRAAPATSPITEPDTQTFPDVELPTTPTPDTDTLIAAIQAAAVSGTPEGARSIAQLILRGVPPRAAAAGLDALGVMGHPEGAPAVMRFLEHRRASLRRHAVAAAAAIHTPELVRALIGKLGDSDENVRIETAAALGEVGNATVVEPLFAAFERDLENTTNPDGGRLAHECAKAIARIGTEEHITRLLGFLRRVPFPTMADAMRAALARRDLSEQLKLRVITAVGDLATGEARAFLQSIVADAHGRETPVVRAARIAAERIAD